MNINQYPSSETTSSLPSLIGIKELFRSSINLFFSNIKLFIGISGIFMLLAIPLWFFSFATFLGAMDAGSFLLLTLAALLTFMWLVAYSWFSGSLIIAVSELTSGKTTTVKKVLKDSRLRKWSFLLSAILFSLFINGGMVLKLILPGIPWYTLLADVNFLYLQMALSPIIYDIFFFFIWYFFCTYVIVYVCENLKGWAALSRSRELVRGHWWSVAIRVFLLCAMYEGINLIISFIPFFPFFGNFTDVLSDFIALPFGTIYFFVLYKSLKTIKEPVALPGV